MHQTFSVSRDDLWGFSKLYIVVCRASDTHRVMNILYFVKIVRFMAQLLG